MKPFFWVITKGSKLPQALLMTYAENFISSYASLSLSKGGGRKWEERNRGKICILVSPYICEGCLECND